MRLLLLSISVIILMPGCKTKQNSHLSSKDSSSPLPAQKISEKQAYLSLATDIREASETYLKEIGNHPNNPKDQALKGIARDYLAQSPATIASALQDKGVIEETQRVASSAGFAYYGSYSRGYSASYMMGSLLKKRKSKVCPLETVKPVTGKAYASKFVDCTTQEVGGESNNLIPIRKNLGFYEAIDGLKDSDYDGFVYNKRTQNILFFKVQGQAFIKEQFAKEEVLNKQTGTDVYLKTSILDQYKKDIGYSEASGQSKTNKAEIVLGATLLVASAVLFNFMANNEIKKTKANRKTIEARGELSRQEGHLKNHSNLELRKTYNEETVKKMKQKIKTEGEKYKTAKGNWANKFSMLLPFTMAVVGSFVIADGHNSFGLAGKDDPKDKIRVKFLKKFATVECKMADLNHPSFKNKKVTCQKLLNKP